MSHASSPQYRQMADESMVRTLAAQMQAIWPQERPLLERVAPPAGGRVLDVGCGTAELIPRLAPLWPAATFTGVDLILEHMQFGRARLGAATARVAFARTDAFALPFADGAFDLTICRHMLQAVPSPEGALAELVRVTRPGAAIHLIAEDYGMIWVHPTRLGAERFWALGPGTLGPALGTDLFVGRHAYTHLAQAGLRDITADYIAVDTLRVPRETFAAIFEAWRDGYAEPIAEHSPLSLDEAIAHFDEMIACIRNPEGFALWLVPVFQARVP